MADLVGGTVEKMMQAELEADLGYAKNDNGNKSTDNSRNGCSGKTLRSEYGEIDIDVPRDRKGEYEPKIVPKYQREIKGLDSQIISVYAKGMSTRSSRSTGRKYPRKWSRKSPTRFCRTSRNGRVGH